MNLPLQTHRYNATRFFIIQTRHPGRLKKQIWVEKNSVGALVTCGKTPTAVT